MLDYLEFDGKAAHQSNIVNAAISHCQHILPFKDGYLFVFGICLPASSELYDGYAFLSYPSTRLN